MAALSWQYVIRRSSGLSLSFDSNLLFLRYVQELETRLLHMETLFNQVTPILEEVGRPENAGASSFIDHPLSSSSIVATVVVKYINGVTRSC